VEYTQRELVREKWTPLLRVPTVVQGGHDSMGKEKAADAGKRGRGRRIFGNIPER